MDELERKVERHDFTLTAYKERFERMEAYAKSTRKDMEAVEKLQRDDHERFVRYIAVAEGATQAAKEAAEKTVTSKQLYISVAVAAIAVIGLILGIPTK